MRCAEQAWGSRRPIARRWTDFSAPLLSESESAFVYGDTPFIKMEREVQSGSLAPLSAAFVRVNPSYTFVDCEIEF